MGLNDTEDGQARHENSKSDGSNELWRESMVVLRACSRHMCFCRDQLECSGELKAVDSISSGYM